MNYPVSIWWLSCQDSDKVPPECHQISTQLQGHSYSYWLLSSLNALWFVQFDIRRDKLAQFWNAEFLNNLAGIAQIPNFHWTAKKHNQMAKEQPQVNANQWWIYIILLTSQSKIQLWADLSVQTQILKKSCHTPNEPVISHLWLSHNA